MAIFVNGCFWHRCPHCDPPHPAANREFWAEKFAANQERDRRKLAELESRGWKVLTVWECTLKATPEEVLADVIEALGNAGRSAACDCQTSGPPA